MRRRTDLTSPVVVRIAESAYFSVHLIESFGYSRGTVHALPERMQGVPRRFVYILRSERDPGRHYVGLTTDVQGRLEWHNHGPSGCTVPNRPWKLLVSMEFEDAAAAFRFERYLKSGSGRAFAKRHFGST